MSEWMIVKDVYQDLACDGYVVEYGKDLKKKEYYFRPHGSVACLYLTQDDCMRKKNKKCIQRRKLMGCRFKTGDVSMVSYSISGSQSQSSGGDYEKFRPTVFYYTEQNQENSQYQEVIVDQDEYLRMKRLFDEQVVEMARMKEEMAKMK
jgi:hypothetical protein